MARLALLLLVLASMNLAGCAAVVVAGAAGAGYAATDEEAGKSVGDFFRRLDEAISRQISGSEQTKKKYNYEESQGLVIRLQDRSIRPRSVQRGNPITLKVEYAVMGAPGDGVGLHLKNSLWFQKQKLATIMETDFKRTDGTWEDSFQVNVPATAEPGIYVIGLVLSVGEKQEKGHVSFTVKS